MNPNFSHSNLKPNPYNYPKPNSAGIQTKYQILNLNPNRIGPAKSELNPISLFDSYYKTLSILQFKSKSNQITNIRF